MHRIGILALHGVLPFDLATPCEVMGRVQVPGTDLPYDIRVCGEARRVRAGHFDLQVPEGLSGLNDVDTIIVPGVADPMMAIPTPVIELLKNAGAHGVRIASICTGAFVLAAAGLLDGKRATTHWLAAPLLATRYPRIAVDPNVLFVDSGQILTSAGATAGVDLCLHIVRGDYGAAVAANASRVAVMPLEREGGQAQYIVPQPVAAQASLQPLLQWLEENLTSPLTLPGIARRASTSMRSLNRKFREQTGMTPLQWVQGARVRRAQQLLETTTLTVEQIATESGFESSTTFREHFQRVVACTPTAYRHAFVGKNKPPREQGDSLSSAREQAGV